MADFWFKEDMPRRGLIARVSRIDPLGLGARARVSYEFDGIDREVVDAGISTKALASPDMIQPFAILRVVTTPTRMDFLLGKIPSVGDWFSLQVGPRTTPGGPLLFHAQLVDSGYNEWSRGSIEEGNFLFDGGGDTPVTPFTSLGAAAVGTADMQMLAAECDFPIPAVVSTEHILATLRTVSKPARVVVQDVGQASFITLEDEKNEPVAYFDVGWPLVFNRKTVPLKFPAPKENLPVILSHWDFDHLLGFYRWPQLRNTKWIVPIQKLGPGAKKIALQLSSGGHLLGWKGKRKSRWFQLASCGPGQNMNDTGLAMGVTLKNGKRVLLVGDANYDRVPFALTAPWDHLVVTHHGADFLGQVPQPVGKNERAAVSVGLGNVYKHPKRLAIMKHKRSGWDLKTTSASATSKRGARPLG